MFTNLLPLFLLVVLTGAVRKACDQKPPLATENEPKENKDLFQLYLDTKDEEPGYNYLPDQTYVVILKAHNDTRPFRWFMITVDDPAADDATDENITPGAEEVDVGSLKTLDTDKQSRYSERCPNSVENADNSDKTKIEVHWVSPKPNYDQNQKIRLRAMVAENQEVWYTGGVNLTIELKKNSNKSIDSPPLEAKEKCGLCSEARYEVVFHGKWSRMTHPRHYPSKPDENGYSHLIGASHEYSFDLWRQSSPASPGMKQLAEEGKITLIEREIINAISEYNGTRTLIRGKRHMHPDMFEPSYALFRVDSVHHLFSVAISMRPSPDWFLGMSQFELCTEKGWLDNIAKIPLYPWDAGTVDGVTYESPPTMTQPPGNIERVAVGSFDRASPFYQKNLNDLAPFAYLEVNRLDVYPLVGEECSDADEQNSEITELHSTEEENNEESDDPHASESRSFGSCHTEWSDWSTCIPDRGRCGTGTQVRMRYRYQEDTAEDLTVSTDLMQESCGGHGENSETRECVVEC